MEKRYADASGMVKQLSAERLQQHESKAQRYVRTRIEKILTRFLAGSILDRE